MLAVPDVTTQPQWLQIERAIEYGKSSNVEVLVTPVR
jgi:hypothetical protein